MPFIAMLHYADIITPCRQRHMPRDADDIDYYYLRDTLRCRVAMPLPLMSDGASVRFIDTRCRDITPP